MRKPENAAYLTLPLRRIQRPAEDLTATKVKKRKVRAWRGSKYATRIDVLASSEIGRRGGRVRWGVASDGRSSS
jgi:hypothetical protein